MGKRLIGPVRLCEELEISDVQLRKLMREGLPYVEIGDRTRRFDLEDVVEWLKDRKEVGG